VIFLRTADVISGPSDPVRLELRCTWSEAGKPVREEKGELVCTKPFPSIR
jgi:hypothetical protein